nr:TIGR03915 family putative DNA repair protein [uncultured Massilia sp.]
MSTGLGAIDQVRAGRPLLVDGFAAWRDAARELLAHDVAPQDVTWGSPLTGGDLLTSAPPPDAAGDNAGTPPSAQERSQSPLRPAPHIPRSLMEMLQSAACCRVPDRWAFLYRVIWRWQQGEHDVQSPADEDGARLNAMVKAVRREEHDMHAYIRFRERPEQAGPPRFVAWYEPRHDVLPQVARHFVARMGKVSWMIATPEASVLWDGQTLHDAGPIVKGPEELDDSGEALWLTYYRSVFNPARLNADIMHQHIASDR